MARSERTLILLSHVDDDDGSTAGILFSIPNVWVEDGIYPLPISEPGMGILYVPISEPRMGIPAISGTGMGGWVCTVWVC